MRRRGVSALHDLLERFRAAAVTEREKGTYFEELTVKYLENELKYRELYRAVLPYAVWAKKRGIDGRNVGINLVAETRDGEVHAIQCKLYAPDYTVQKGDIDSFFTASGKEPFTQASSASSSSRSVRSSARSTPSSFRRSEIDTTGKTGQRTS